MARPKKKKTVLRSYRFPTVRCTVDDLKAVKEKARKVGLTMSEYIRKSTIDEELKTAPASGGDPNFHLVQALGKIGINLNQLTKVANATGELSPKLDEVYDQLQGVLNHLVEKSLKEYHPDYPNY